MTQDKVNEFIDRTISSLCQKNINVDFIIERLRENSKKYFEILESSDHSQTKKNYLSWYIIHADKRIEDFKSVQKIGQKIGKNNPDQIFKLVKLKDKLSHITSEKIVQFD